MSIQKSLELHTSVIRLKLHNANLNTANCILPPAIKISWDKFLADTKPLMDKIRDSYKDSPVKSTYLKSWEVLHECRDPVTHFFKFGVLTPGFFLFSDELQQTEEKHTESKLSKIQQIQAFAQKKEYKKAIVFLSCIYTSLSPDKRKEAIHAIFKDLKKEDYELLSEVLYPLITNAPVENDILYEIVFYFFEKNQKNLAVCVSSLMLGKSLSPEQALKFRKKIIDEFIAVESPGLELFENYISTVCSQLFKRDIYQHLNQLADKEKDLLKFVKEFIHRLKCRNLKLYLLGETFNVLCERKQPESAKKILDLLSWDPDAFVEGIGRLSINYACIFKMEEAEEYFKQLPKGKLKDTARNHLVRGFLQNGNNPAALKYAKECDKAELLETLKYSVVKGYNHESIFALSRLLPATSKDEVALYFFDYNGIEHGIKLSSDLLKNVRQHLLSILGEHQQPFLIAFFKVIIKNQKQHLPKLFVLLEEIEPGEDKDLILYDIAAASLESDCKKTKEIAALIQDAHLKNIILFEVAFHQKDYLVAFQHAKLMNKEDNFIQLLPFLMNNRHFEEAADAILRLDAESQDFYHFMLSVTLIQNNKIEEGVEIRAKIKDPSKFTLLVEIEALQELGNAGVLSKETIAQFHKYSSAYSEGIELLNTRLAKLGKAERFEETIDLCALKDRISTMQIPSEHKKRINKTIRERLEPAQAGLTAVRQEVIQTKLKQTAEKKELFRAIKEKGPHAKKAYYASLKSTQNLNVILHPHSYGMRKLLEANRINDAKSLISLITDKRKQQDALKELFQAYRSLGLQEDARQVAEQIKVKVTRDNYLKNFNKREGHDR